MGFASLPEQVHRKAVRRGFDFTLMVVGTLRVRYKSLIILQVHFKKKIFQTNHLILFFVRFTTFM